MGILKTLSDMFGVEKHPKNLNYGTMTNGVTPIYSGRSQNIFVNDVVQQTLDAIVNELKKLRPRHIRYDGFDPIPVRGAMQRLLEDPNPLMTTSEFIEKWAWMLLLTYNSFIYIQKDEKGAAKGLWPLNPQQVTFMQDPAGRLYLKMAFGSGYESTVPYDSIIHLKSHFAQNDLMGGDEFGRPNHQNIKKTVEINDDLLEGIRKAMKISLTINGIVKYNTLTADKNMVEDIKKFEKHLMDSESGLLPLDLTNEYIPITHNVKLIDKDTLQFLDSKITRNWHTPAEIITGKYTSEDYASFYQSAIEPIAISASQSFTKKLFTEQQKGGYRNEIVLYPKELVFMNPQQTLAMVKELGQTGALFENEKRVAFGYEPMEELKGIRYQSLNWVRVEYAQQYQINQDKTKRQNDEMQELVNVEDALKIQRGEE